MPRLPIYHPWADFKIEPRNVAGFRQRSSSRKDKTRNVPRVETQEKEQLCQTKGDAHQKEYRERLEKSSHRLAIDLTTESKPVQDEAGMNALANSVRERKPDGLLVILQHMSWKDGLYWSIWETRVMDFARFVQEEGRGYRTAGEFWKKSERTTPSPSAFPAPGGMAQGSLPGQVSRGAIRRAPLCQTAGNG